MRMASLIEHIFSRPIHIVVWISISLLFMFQITLCCMDIPLFVYPFITWWTYEFFTHMSRYINIHVQVFVLFKNSFRCTSKSRIAEPHGVPFNIVRNYQTTSAGSVFYILTSNVWFPISPHFCQNFPFVWLYPS